MQPSFKLTLYISKKKMYELSVLTSLIFVVDITFIVSFFECCYSIKLSNFGANFAR